MVASVVTSHQPVNSHRYLPLRKLSIDAQPVDFKEVFSTVLDLFRTCSLSPSFNTADIPACIKTMRIKDFYGLVRRAVGVKTNHGLQRKFEPYSFRKDRDGRAVHSKKWRGYERGQHMPHPNTVTKIEKIAGVKLRHELDKLLWIAMDITAPLGCQARPMLESLPRDIRNPALRILDKLNSHGAPSDSDIFTWCQYILSNEQGIPALAALTILLRKASELGNVDAASNISWCLFHMLILLGEELHQRGIANMLYSFYLEHILSLYWGKIDESAKSMARMSMLLNILAFVDEKNLCTEKLLFKDRAMNMYQWLDYFWGESPLAAFQPMFLSFTRAGYSESFVSKMKTERNMAWSMLIRTIKNGHPPMVLNPDYLEIDLDLKLLTEPRFEPLVSIASQILVK